MIKHIYKIEGKFEFESGGSIDNLEVAYHTSPFGYSPDKKVIWLCHALTADSDPEGSWWPALVGPGRLIDTEKYFVICANVLGSACGSSSPASANPKTGKPYYFDFPRVTVRDTVRAFDLLRQHLGIEKIDLMVGPSIGGFQALEWVIMEPDVVGEAVFLATATRVTPFMTALNESQRMALQADPTFTEAKSLNGGKKGLACARSIALISYRTFDGYNFTQSEENQDCMFADRAASYQRYQGKKLADRFDAYSYWYLTKMLDSMNVGRNRGGVVTALSLIKAACHVISIDSDALFPPKYGKATVVALGNAEYHELSSLYGHDGFLIENEHLCHILRSVVDKSLAFSE